MSSGPSKASMKEVTRILKACKLKQYSHDLHRHKEMYGSVAQLKLMSKANFNSAMCAIGMKPSQAEKFYKAIHSCAQSSSPNSNNRQYGGSRSRSQSRGSRIRSRGKRSSKIKKSKKKNKEEKFKKSKS